MEEQTRKIRVKVPAKKTTKHSSRPPAPMPAHEPVTSQLRIVETDPTSPFQVNLTVSGWRAALLYFGTAMMMGYVMGIVSAVIGGV